MRPGLLEIAIILIVITLILVVTRIVRAERHTADKDDTSEEISVGQGTERSGKALQRLRAAGIIFLIIGLISLLAGVSLFKWVYWSFLWSFIAITIGFVMVIMSKKK